MQDKGRLVVIAGPTATGKSALAVKLAQMINGEVVSADSVQVYKHMDIGSAKITPAEMEGVPHHLIDVLDPKEDFNVSVFKDMAERAVRDIHGRGRTPILTGGTGFYIQALCHDIDFNEGETDVKVRERLEELGRNKGNAYLYELLKEKDPDYAKITPRNNVKRVIRALEYIELTGERFSVRNLRQSMRPSPYELYFFVLTLPREKLYELIDSRVDSMIKAGLIEEVVRLKEMGCTPGMTSMCSLGYAQIYKYLSGELSLDRAVYEIKRDTRHFAKRQLTWFKREKNTIFIDRDEFPDNEAIAEHIKGMIDNGRQF